MMLVINNLGQDLRGLFLLKTIILEVSVKFTTTTKSDLMLFLQFIIKYD